MSSCRLGLLLCLIGALMALSPGCTASSKFEVYFTNLGDEPVSQVYLEHKTIDEDAVNRAAAGAGPRSTVLLDGVYRRGRDYNALIVFDSGESVSLAVNTDTLFADHITLWVDYTDEGVVAGYYYTLPTEYEPPELPSETPLPELTPTPFETPSPSTSAGE